MFKRVLLAASAMLLSVGMMAQTVDFTGITVNTERVTKKKVYERKSFVLADGVLFTPGPTGLIGARYGMVWLFGFYVGGEVGINGPIGLRIDTSGDAKNLTGKAKRPAWMFNAGIIIRVSKVVNLYAGPTLFGYAEYLESADGKWVKNRSYHDPFIGGEWGVFLHFGRVTLMPGVFVGGMRYDERNGYGYDDKTATAAGKKLGVGFNF